MEVALPVTVSTDVEKLVVVAFVVVDRVTTKFGNVELRVVEVAVKTAAVIEPALVRLKPAPSILPSHGVWDPLTLPIHVPFTATQPLVIFITPANVDVPVPETVSIPPVEILFEKVPLLIVVTELVKLLICLE